MGTYSEDTNLVQIPRLFRDSSKAHDCSVSDHFLRDRIEKRIQPPLEVCTKILALVHFIRVDALVLGLAEFLLRLRHEILFEPLSHLGVIMREAQQRGGSEEWM
jgi:hypothetical protein